MHWPVNHLHGHLLPLGVIINSLQRNLYVVRHVPALHNYPSALTHNLQYSNERFFAPLHNCHNLPLCTVFGVFLAGYGCPYLVSVEGMQHIFLGDENVIFPVGNNNKSKTLTGHLHRSLHHLVDFAGGAPSLVLLCKTLFGFACTLLSFFSHN